MSRERANNEERPYCESVPENKRAHVTGAHHLLRVSMMDECVMQP